MDAMKLHTVFVTYNRLELTKQAIQSYLDTVTVPSTMLVVDNASRDGTREWLMANLGPDLWRGWAWNAYPGKSTNWGWSLAPDDATHLHRADNDFGFLPGWCEEVARKFQEGGRGLGQLGLRTDEQESNHGVPVKSNVGGNCIVPRHLWDEGLRWDERPWPQLAEEIGPGHTEDGIMSAAVKQMGYYWDRVDRTCIVPLAEDTPDDDYYQQTWRDRSIHQDMWR